jgi:hypothetical protein
MGNPHIGGYWRSAIGYSTAPAAAVKGEMGKSAYHRLLAIGDRLFGGASRRGIAWSRGDSLIVAWQGLPG